ncbi:MAG: hypothetical protein ABWY29_13885 [Blastococcus sp.]
MPTARDLLQRFRPVGTPGAAAPAGVPADRGAELSRELQPVFDELAGADEEAGRIRLVAAAEARARRDRAQQQASALVEAARRNAQRARADAAAALVRQAEEEDTAVLAAADQDAAAVTRQAASRYAGLVQQVVRAVRDLAAERTPSPTP